MSLFRKKEKSDSVFESAQFEVVGVTFKNKDGSSRQAILEQLLEDSKGLFKNKKVDAYIEPYQYKNSPALSVDCSYGSVGNIAASAVPAVSRLLPRMVSSELKIYIAENYDGKVTYCADVVLNLRPDEGSNCPVSTVSANQQYSMETLAVTGHTSKNPDGEFVQEVLGRLVRSDSISVSFGSHPEGKSGTTYVYANGMVVGYIYKKDQARLDELLSISDKVELNIITTDSGPGYTDYHKSELIFYCPE